jgi:uncharacterized protein YceH (UPF0502 family)
MLRGPQTPGELKQRAERLHPFSSLDDVEAVLNGLIDRDLVVHLERRPGQKEARYAQLLGTDDGPSTAVVAPTLDEVEAPTDRISALEERVARLEEALAALEPRDLSDA